MTRLAAIGCTLLVWLTAFAPRIAEAHQIGLSRGQYTALPDGVEARLVFDGDELGRIVEDRARAGGGSALDSSEARGTFERWIVQQIRVGDRAGRGCPGTLRQVEIIEQGGVVLLASYRCEGAPDNVELQFWDELSPGHRHLASSSPSAAGEAAEQILYRERPRLQNGLERGLENGLERGLELSPPESTSLSPFEWIRLGVEHILGGYDHLLFLLALVLVTPALRTLTATVSVFTLAHSITLALSTLGVFAPPPGLVECAIALSISYVGLENLTERASRPRFLIVLAFGLIHGFGFAGALAELGLPQARTPGALLAFNVGVELGQLGVLAIAYPVIQLLCRTRWFVPRAVPALSLCTALVGVLWFLERI
jgi:hydrogenase/urease accessory protein HupE